MTIRSECERCSDHLLPYLAGASTPDGRAWIEEHLRGCESCQREATFWRATIAELDAQDERTIPPDVHGEEAWWAARAQLGADRPSLRNTTGLETRETVMRVMESKTAADGATANGPRDSRRRGAGLAALWRLVAAALLVMALLGAGLYAAALAGQPQGPATVQQVKLAYTGTGQLAAPAGLATPDGLYIQLTAVERGESRWLFAFVVTNHSDHTQDLLSSGADHRFVLVGARPAGTPADQGLVFLARPAAEESDAHPALPSAVAAGAMAQGWLAADLSGLGYPPQLLMYRYATVHTRACQNPRVLWTCHPADLYSVLEWDL